RVLAPQLEMGGSAGPGTRGGDAATDGGRSGEGHQVHLGVGDQSGPYLGASAGSVEHPGGQMLGEHIGQDLQRQRGVGGGFHHHRVAGGESGSDLEGEQQQRVVEGNQGRHHPVRDPPDQRELAGVVGGGDAATVDSGQLG